MQSNDFEKHVQKELADFRLEPTDNVWNNISIRIAKKKRRRLAFFWFAFILLLAGVGSAYIFNGMQDHVITDYVSMAKENQQVKLPVGPSEVKQGNTFAKAQPTVTMQATSSTYSGSIGGNEKPNEMVRSVRQVPAAKAFPALSPTNQVQKAELGTNNSISPKKSDELVKTEEAYNSVSPLDVQHENSDVSTTTADTKSPAETGLLLQSTSKNNSPVKTKKPWAFGFSVASGFSGNLIQENKNTSQVQGRSLSLVTAGVSNAPTTPLRFSPDDNFSIKANLFAQKELGKNLALKIGIGYQYFSTSIRLGQHYSNTRTFYDSALAKQAEVTSYHVEGNTSRQLNKYHFVQLPVNVLWNPNALKKRFSVFAGITPGYLLHGSAWYANQSQRMYYLEKDQFTRWQLSGQAGALITLKNSRRLKLEVGPELQLQATNMVKPAMDQRQRLFFYGIKTNVLLK